MANGQQKAAQNLDSFITWSATQTDEDFKQIIFRGQLNRGQVAKAIGCGKSALIQNPALKAALADLENKLRAKGILPPLSETAKQSSGTSELYDTTSQRKILDLKRVSQLEAENIELKVRVKELEKRLERFGELSETLSEMGLIPR